MAYQDNSLNTQLTGINVPGLGTAGSDLLRINDVDPNFAFLNDGTALLYRTLALLGSDTAADQPQYWFFNDDQYAVTTTADGALSDSDVTLTVIDSIGIVGTAVGNPATGEIMLITAVPTSTTWTVTRGYQGTPAAIIADGAEIALMGSVLEEFGAVKGGIVQLPNKVDNYVSFFSNSVNSSDLEEVTKMLNGVGQVGGEFNKMTLFQMRQMDRALRLSKGYLDTNFSGNGKAAYYTKGLNEYITTDAELPATGLDWFDFNEQFNDAFLPTNSSPTKTLLCSQKMFSAISAVSWNRWTANPKFEKSLGATIGQVVLDGGGVIDIMLDKHGFTSTGTQGYLLDLPYVKLKEMNGFGLQWRETTLPTEHGVTHEVFSSTSMKLQLPELHRTVSLV